MDPFVQLTIGKKNGLKFVNDTHVQIAYAKRYSKELLNDSQYGADVPEADLEMQSAISEGLSQPDSWISQQIQRSCPSGNCTWDTFTSLAVCSACHDITNRIEKVEGTDHLAGRIYKIYRLPNQLVGGDARNMMVAYGTANCTKTVSFNSFDTLIWSMTMMNYTMKEERANSGNLTATECGLWYCVNSYKSAVENGILTEIIQPAPSKKEIDSWRPIKKKGQQDNGVVILSPMTLHSLVGTYNLPEPALTVRRTDLQLGEGFNLSQGAFYSIANIMHDTFSIPLVPRTPHGTIGTAFVSKSQGDGPNNFNPPVMQILYNSQDLAATFAALAKSITNNIRRNGNNHTVFDGKEGKYVTLIRIRGWFLILPVILIVGGAVFLAVVLHHTQRSGMEFWGTNALPIVALGEKMGPVFNDSDMRLAVMEQIAKRQLVQFPSVPRRDFDEIDTLNPPVIQIPSTAEASITSPTRTSMIQNQSADVEGIASPLRISVTRSLSTGVEDNIVSPLRNSAIQSPSSDDVSLMSNDA